MEQDLVDQESTFWNTSCLKGHVPQVEQVLKERPRWVGLGDFHMVLAGSPISKNWAHIGKFTFFLHRNKQTLFLYSLKAKLGTPIESATFWLAAIESRS